MTGQDDGSAGKGPINKEASGDSAGEDSAGDSSADRKAGGKDVRPDAEQHLDNLSVKSGERVGGKDVRPDAEQHLAVEQNPGEQQDAEQQAADQQDAEQQLGLFSGAPELQLEPTESEPVESERVESEPAGSAPPTSSATQAAETPEITPPSTPQDPPPSPPSVFTPDSPQDSPLQDPPPETSPSPPSVFTPDSQEHQPDTSTDTGTDTQQADQPDQSQADQPQADQPQADQPQADQPEDPGDLLAGVVGQPEAVKMLREALITPVPSYLFVGPPGSGIRDVACRFAGELLAQASDTPATQRHLALAQQHPDLVVFDRVGPSLTAEQARNAVRQASIAPATGNRKVLVVCDLHLALTTAAILLKAVEEPTPSTIFILLAEQIPPHLQTLSSRSVRIDFAPLDDDAIAEVLRTEGVSEERLALAARSAGGSIERARLLGSDDAAMERINLWRSVLDRLDGSGASAAVLVEEVLTAIEASTKPLKDKQQSELAEQQSRAEEYSLTTTGASVSVRDRHKRELRRLTTDELHMGFEVLAEEIRQRTLAKDYSAQAAAARLQAVRATADLMIYNVNNRLALQNLMLKISA